MDDKLTTDGLKATCLECKNEFDLDSNVSVGDVVECPYCGIEYEVLSETDGNYELMILDEEK